MEEKDQRNFIDSLTRVIEDKSDILEEERIKADVSKLREFLNG